MANEQDTPRMAKVIRVTQYAGSGKLEIDGEPFPFHISEDGVTATVTRNSRPGAMVTLLAERVEIIDDLNTEASHA